MKIAILKLNERFTFIYKAYDFNSHNLNVYST